MRKVILFCTMLIGASAAVHAQTAIPVQGAINGVEGNVLSVTTREGRDMKIELAKDAAISYPKMVKLEDIKPGTALGVTAAPGPDGKLVASRVSVSTNPLRREGHWNMDKPGDTMTNGSVSGAAQRGNGRELTVSYKDGSNVIFVPENTPIVMPIAADRSYLKRGEYVALTASMDNDGKLIASRVQVSKDGVRPQ